ncbi:MAG: hypothetical protein MK211_11755 [Flavobacteriales bacterium]|nr:hypothetical protein [Flavobacteriales bacterium]
MKSPAIIAIELIVFFLIPYCFYGQHTELGEGFFSPNTNLIETLYLYETPNRNAERMEPPIDSITFVKRYASHIDGVGHTPQEFDPFVEKLDYGIFLLRVRRLGRDYTEIYINEESKKTVYVASNQGSFMTWGQFLLNCHSVEFIDNAQKVFDNPMIKSAGRVVSPAYFRPRYVMGNWMEVEILDDDYNKVTGRGWIRWRKDGKLLVLFNLFA